ncbi:MAG: carboxypeptidase-like regulatory domain-containing protein [Chitinophagaceae bacterium]
MKRASWLFFFLFLSCIGQSQIIITGKVLDSATREPLPGASVFAQNTTQGTTCDKDGKFSISLKSGGYELIFSFTGYKSQELRITENINESVEILLVKEDKSMGEVIIQSSNEVKDGWDKYGDFFLAHFIGATPFAKDCQIKNKDSVRFFYYKRSDKLKVLTTEPLQIGNDALGYELRYQLDSFVYYYKTELSSYRGTCFFSEKLGTVSQAMVWKANREKAYFGSLMHFMRSYYDSTLKESGFTISAINDDKKTFGLLTNPYLGKYYTVSDTLNEVQIRFPDKISVAYIRAVPDDEYLKKNNLPMDVGIQVSYVDVLKPITIKENGYYFDQKNWIKQGYWTWKNVADLLPYDYIPF